MSPTRSVASVLGVAALAAAAWTGVTPTTAAARAAAPPDTNVDITSLPRGAPPAVPYLRLDQHLIRDGARRVRVRWPGSVRVFDRVRGGYVLGGHSKRMGDWLAVYGRDGHRRHVLLRRPARFLAGVRVSWDRRRVAYALQDSHTTRIVIRRVGTGGEVADRTFDRRPSMLAFNHRVLLWKRASYPHGDTLWWTPGKRALETYHHDGSASAADLSAGQVLMAQADGTWMLSIPRGAAPRWQVTWEQLAGWSPDDGRIAFLGRFDDVDSWAYQRLDVVSHDGVPERGFTGYFQSGLGDGPELRWERPDRFLVEAYALGVGETVAKAAVVRCRVDGTCERVTPVYDVDQYEGTPYRFATRGRG